MYGYVDFKPFLQLSGKVANIVQGFIRQTYDDAVTCFRTKYLGCKRVTEALPPLLHLSTSGARIVNLSSLRGELKVQKLYRLQLTLEFRQIL